MWSYSVAKITLTFVALYFSNTDRVIGRRINTSIREALNSLGHPSKLKVHLYFLLLR